MKTLDEVLWGLRAGEPDALEDAVAFLKPWVPSFPVRDSYVFRTPGCSHDKYISHCGLVEQSEESRQLRTWAEPFLQALVIWHSKQATKNVP